MIDSSVSETRLIVRDQRNAILSGCNDPHEWAFNLLANAVEPPLSNNLALSLKPVINRVPVTFPLRYWRRSE
jgi:hypothetical protein